MSEKEVINIHDVLNGADIILEDVETGESLEISEEIEPSDSDVLVSSEMVEEPEEISDAEITEEATEKEDGILSASDIRDLQESLSMMNSMIESAKDMFSTEADLNGVKPEIYKSLIDITEEELEKYSDAQIETLYLSFSNKTKTDFTKEEIREGLINLKKSADELRDIVNQSEDLKKEIDKEVKKYSEYVLSPEYTKKYERRIENLKEKLKYTEDEEERKKLSNSLEILTNTKTLDFLFTRFKKYSEKETKNIVEAFFSSSKSAYILKRFRENSKKLHLDSNLYARFLHLEEKYLPENYHEFNNLFMFIIIRMIAYMDKNDRSDILYVGSIIQQLTKLYRDKFDEENKTKFIVTIENVLNYFMSYSDTFKKDNESYKLHPFRIEHEKRLKEMAEAKKKEEEIMNQDTEGKEEVSESYDTTDYDTINNFSVENTVSRTIADMECERCDKKVEEYLEQESDVLTKESTSKMGRGLTNSTVIFDESVKISELNETIETFKTDAKENNTDENAEDNLVINGKVIKL